MMTIDDALTRPRSRHGPGCNLFRNQHWGGMCQILSNIMDLYKTMINHTQGTGVGEIHLCPSGMVQHCPTTTQPQTNGLIRLIHALAKFHCPTLQTDSYAHILRMHCYLLLHYRNRDSLYSASVQWHPRLDWGAQAADWGGMGRMNFRATRFQRKLKWKMLWKWNLVF